MPRSLPAPRITLQEMFRLTAEKHPAKPAAIFDGVALSYSELKARAEALAGYLQNECGVKTGERVLLGTDS